MVTTEQELLSFVEFARKELQGGNSDQSIEELFALWRSQYPTSDDRAEALAIIQQGDADIASGNYRTLDEFINEFRTLHSISPDA